MKKWIFVLVPAALLGIFLVFYTAELTRIDAHEKEVKARKDQKDAEKKAADAESQAKAKVEAEKRAAETLAKEKEEADRKFAEWDAANRGVKEETAKANAEMKKHTDEVARLELETASVRAQKDRTEREYLEASLKATEALTALRSTELEIKRITQMIATRLDQSILANPPLPPPTGTPGAGRGGGQGGQGSQGGGRRGGS